jgi:hypothetical protein
MNGFTFREEGTRARGEGRAEIKRDVEDQERSQAVRYRHQVLLCSR